MKIILQKFIAASGLCSRRRAEELIRLGKVTVNGTRAELGMKAKEGDDVRVHGKKIVLPKEKIHIKLNKPAGYTCTNRKFEGEKNVFALLAGIKTPLRGRGLIIAGRLDKDSRGLLVLTNDGDLTARLTHPRYGHRKLYRVSIFNFQFSIFKGKEVVSRLKNGIDIGNGDGVVRAKQVKYLGGNKFDIVLTEGKKRQIRRMFRSLGYEIEDLIRTAIGGVRLGDLPEGKWRYLTTAEIKKLKDIKI